jgi:hypothetical protein
MIILLPQKFDLQANAFRNLTIYCIYIQYFISARNT